MNQSSFRPNNGIKNVCSFGHFGENKSKHLSTTKPMPNFLPPQTSSNVTQETVSWSQKVAGNLPRSRNHSKTQLNETPTITCSKNLGFNRAEAENTTKQKQNRQTPSKDSEDSITSSSTYHEMEVIHNQTHPFISTREKCNKNKNFDSNVREKSKKIILCNKNVDNKKFGYLNKGKINKRRKSNSSSNYIGLKNNKSVENRYNDRQNTKYCPPRFAANGRNSSKSVSYFGDKNNTQSPYNYTQNDRQNYNYQNYNFEQKYKAINNNQEIALNSIKGCMCPYNGVIKCRNHSRFFSIADFGANSFRKVDFVALVCSNNGCLFSKFDLNYMSNVPLIHKSCLLNLENDLVSILKNSDATLGYSDRDRKARLWDSCNQWIKNCYNFGEYIKCHECNKNNLQGYLKPNSEFNLEAFLENFKNFQTSDCNQNFNTSKVNKSIFNNKEQCEEINRSNIIVHKPRKLPLDWSITPITGNMTGTLQNFEITEPWLNDKNYPKDYNNLAFNSEVEWLKAKLKYQKICNSNKNLRDGHVDGENLSTTLKNINNSEYESMSKVTFPSRLNFDDFKNIIKVTKLNSYNVMMEAGHELNGQSFGIDDLRKQILSNLSHNYCNTLACTLCQSEKKICHEFPLIAGLMYLSDEKSSSRVSVQIHNDGRICYLHGVCLECCQGSEREIVCKFCQTKWNGGVFTMGTLYMFDVFACFPCCAQRKICKDCNKPAINSSNNLKSFSSYSQKFPCQNCGLTNYHLVHNTLSYSVKYKTPIRNKFTRFESNYLKQRRLSNSPLENLKEEEDVVNSIFNKSNNKILIQNSKLFKSDFKKSNLNKIFKPFVPSKINTSPEYSSNSLSSSGLGKSNSLGNSVGSNEEISPTTNSPYLSKTDRIVSNSFSKSRNTNSTSFGKSSSIFDGPSSPDFEHYEKDKEYERRMNFKNEKKEKESLYDVCDIFCRPVN